jgi:hypothetical protein
LESELVPLQARIDLLQGEAGQADEHGQAIYVNSKLVVEASTLTVISFRINSTTLS